MAWYFTLAAECGDMRAAADEFCQHFHNWDIVLGSGERIRCSAAVDPQDGQGNWWGIVVPSGFRYPFAAAGQTYARSGREIAAVGGQLYDRLRAAPDFRYAIVGWEVDQFRTMQELYEEDPNLIARMAGLVIREQIWISLGKPASFTAFRAGYVWKRYDEEKWKAISACGTRKNSEMSARERAGLGVGLAHNGGAW